MKNKYLYKVVNQIVGETTIDHTRKMIYLPFDKDGFSFNTPYLFFSIFTSFTSHVRDIYGLTKKEIIYVWEQWKLVIIAEIGMNLL